MSVDQDGMFGARCDYGFKSKDESGCGERAQDRATNQAAFVRALRRYGWRVSRTTDEPLIRFHRKWQETTEAEWARIKPASIYSARCPEHAGQRT